MTRSHPMTFQILKPSGDYGFRLAFFVKWYDFVAGVLIAFACSESFKIEGDYKGFLTFVAKTKLIKWYKKRFSADIFPVEKHLPSFRFFIR